MILSYHLLLLSIFFSNWYLSRHCLVFGFGFGFVCFCVSVCFFGVVFGVLACFVSFCVLDDRDSERPGGSDEGVGRKKTAVAKAFNDSLEHVESHANMDGAVA